MAFAGPTWLGRSLGLMSELVAGHWWALLFALSLFWSSTDAGGTYRPTESAHCKVVCVGEGELDGLGMCEGGLAENNNAN